MKIAQVVCAYPPYKGGMGNVARDFARLARASGNESYVFTVGNNSFGTAANNEEIKVQRLRPLFKYGNGAFLPQFFYCLRNFDIVHLHYPYYGVAEVIFCAKFFLRQRFKLIIHYHMDTPSLSGIAKVLSIFSRMAAKPLFAAAGALTYASEDYMEKSALSGYFHKQKKKFFLLPFGVDTDKFCPTKEEHSQKTNYILFVGGLDRAHYFKGVENLLKAAQGILNKNLQLIIVGQGDMQDYYKQLAKDLGQEAFVDFAGGASDAALIEYYQNASFLVLPSINSHEAFGIVLLEAMSCGIPVIASDLPGVRNVFTGGQEGLMVIPGDVADLRKKIAAMSADENSRKKMGEKARKLVLEKYGLEILKQRLNQIYGG